jgi:acetylornithine deacetylase
MRRDTLQQSELWEIARKLVGFNMVSAGSNVQAAEYISNFLEENGFTVRLVRETVKGVEKASVLAWAGPEEPGGLILSGHIDSVPFEGQPGWTGDALVMHTDGERIVGRDVADMKVFLAQAMLALMYIFTCDEELAAQGAGQLIKVLPDLLRGYPLPEVALIGEATDFEFFPAHKGYAVFDIVTRGKGGHSNAPHRGPNAIEKLAEMNHEFQQRVSAENAVLFPEFPATVFNSGVITGGLAANYDRRDLSTHDEHTDRSGR